METPDYGRAVELEPGVRVVVARNPSPMTHWGTNTYLVGHREVVVVDPGPDQTAHFRAILEAIAGARVSAILVTHAHRDHSPLAPRLAREVGAPVIGFGPPEAGRSARMAGLAAEQLAGGGEGVDEAFRPDRTMADGDRIEVEGAVLEVLHTPGHFAGHLSFALGDAVLTGDHVMGWASTLVSPPDGDVARFMETTERLRRRTDRVFYPGHGAPVEDPTARLDWLLDHRRKREAAIIAAVDEAPLSLAEIAARIYTDLTPALMPAAERNVFAHLIDLVDRNAIDAAPRLSVGARFSRL